MQLSLQVSCFSLIVVGMQNTGAAYITYTEVVPELRLFEFLHLCCNAL